jgi:predicted RNase H-like nuclease (RuvC/YqgF family)
VNTNEALRHEVADLKAEVMRLDERIAAGAEPGPRPNGHRAKLQKFRSELRSLMASIRRKYSPTTAVITSQAPPSLQTDRITPLEVKAATNARDVEEMKRRMDELKNQLPTAQMAPAAASFDAAALIASLRRAVSKALDSTEKS